MPTTATPPTALEPRPVYGPANGIQYQQVTTHDLAEGDVVITHGLVVRLGERHISTSHANDGPGGEVVWFPTVILNRHHCTGGELLWALRMADTNHTNPGSWAIQGNRLAYWGRVLPATLPDDMPLLDVPPCGCWRHGDR